MNTSPYDALYDRNPFKNFVYLLITIIVGLIAGNILGVAWAAVALEGRLTDLALVLADPLEYPGARTSILALQAVVSLVAFIVAPLVFLHLRYKAQLGDLVMKKPAKWAFWGSLLLFFAAIPLLEFLIHFNQAITLPESLQSIYDWALTKERELKVLTEYLTSFDSPAQYALGVVAIAIIPAIGEELTFRALLQPQMSAVFKNVHLGIWVSAILFSAFHMQFFGFLPRVFLGAIFGYMYLYSGNLLLPIAAHFLNNFIGITYAYFSGNSLDSDQSYFIGPNIWLGLISGLICLSIILLIRKASEDSGGASHE